MTRLMSVLLPDPLDPTSAVVVPAAATNDTRFSTGTPGSYSNDTSWNTTSPLRTPRGSRDASSSSSVAIALISRMRSSPASASDSCVPIDDIWMSGAASMPTKKMYMMKSPSVMVPARMARPPTTIMTTPIAPMTMPPNDVTAEIPVSVWRTLVKQVEHAGRKYPVLALLGDVGLDDPNAAERFAEPARNPRGDLAALAEERTKPAERDNHPGGEQHEHHDADERELPVQIEKDGQRDDRRHQPSDQLHETRAHQVPDAIRVVHHARDQHAGLRRIEIARGKPRDVPLHAHAHVRNGLLGGDAEHLRERKRRCRIDERGGARRGCERDQQVGAAPADHVVDEELGGGGKDQAGEPVDEHQREPERQASAMRPDELPGLGPGVGEVDFALAGFRHGYLA